MSVFIVPRVRVVGKDAIRSSKGQEKKEEASEACSL